MRSIPCNEYDLIIVVERVYICVDSVQGCVVLESEPFGTHEHRVIQFQQGGLRVVIVVFVLLRVV